MPTQPPNIITHHPSGQRRSRGYDRESLSLAGLENLSLHQGEGMEPLISYAANLVLGKPLILGGEEITPPTINNINSLQGIVIPPPPSNAPVIPRDLYILGDRPYVPPFNNHNNSNQNHNHNHPSNNISHSSSSSSNPNNPNALNVLLSENSNRKSPDLYPNLTANMRYYRNEEDPTHGLRKTRSAPNIFIHSDSYPFDAAGNRINNDYVNNHGNGDPQYVYSDYDSTNRNSATSPTPPTEDIYFTSDLESEVSDFLGRFSEEFQSDGEGFDFNSQIN